MTKLELFDIITATVIGAGCLLGGLKLLLDNHLENGVNKKYSELRQVIENTNNILDYEESIAEYESFISSPGVWGDIYRQRLLFGAGALITLEGVVFPLIYLETRRDDFDLD